MFGSEDQTRDYSLILFLCNVLLVTHVLIGRTIPDVPYGVKRRVQKERVQEMHSLNRNREPDFNGWREEIRGKERPIASRKKGKKRSGITIDSKRGSAVAGGLGAGRTPRSSHRRLVGSGDERESLENDKKSVDTELSSIQRVNSLNNSVGKKGQQMKFFGGKGKGKRKSRFYVEDLQNQSRQMNERALKNMMSLVDRKHARMFFREEMSEEDGSDCDKALQRELEQRRLSREFITFGKSQILDKGGDDDYDDMNGPEADHQVEIIDQCDDDLQKSSLSHLRNVPPIQDENLDEDHSDSLYEKSKRHQQDKKLFKFVPKIKSQIQSEKVILRNKIKPRFIHQVSAECVPKVQPGHAPVEAIESSNEYSGPKGGDKRERGLTQDPTDNTTPEQVEMKSGRMRISLADEEVGNSQIKVSENGDQGIEAGDLGVGDIVPQKSPSLPNLSSKSFSEKIQGIKEMLHQDSEASYILEDAQKRLEVQDNLNEGENEEKIEREDNGGNKDVDSFAISEEDQELVKQSLTQMMNLLDHSRNKKKLKNGRVKKKAKNDSKSNPEESPRSKRVHRSYTETKTTKLTSLSLNIKLHKSETSVKIISTEGRKFGSKVQNK